jgi:hypothetical protein
LIVGEAVIGKSRLVQEYRNRLGSTAHTWIEAGAAPFFHNTLFTSFLHIRHDRFLPGQRRPGHPRHPNSTSATRISTQSAIP